jgi:Leucine-rich repeat (LRR) protein
MTKNNKIIFWIAVVVIVLVAGWFAYSMLRAKKNVAPPVPVDTGVEVTSTAVADVNPTSVFRLNLRNQPYAEVPMSVFQMPNLVLLNFGNDGLTSVPPEIGDLQNLQSLYLNQNPQLTNLPDTIGNLKNLRILSLYGDGLTSLPTSIVELTNLTILGLSGNPIPSTTITQLRKELPNTTID